MSEAKTGNLPITLATYLYILSDRGTQPDDAALVAALAAMNEAGEDADHDALGQALVALVRDGLGGSDAELGAVVAYLGRLYGADHIATSLGEDRESRARGARSYEFKTALPWIARIINRFDDGHVGSHWVMVETVTDTVRCMDPYPWDDLDEEYEAPLIDFMVKWELAGGESVRWVPA